jgi:pimeloyl-ACP methyl ester carboxylesterase
VFEGVYGDPTVRFTRRGGSRLDLCIRRQKGDAMEFTTSADGTRIAFERQGSGQPIVLVHGTTGSTESWALVVPLLAERFTVVAMDRRGHGSSEPGPSHSLDLEAEDVIAVIEVVGEPVHLVGHSGGARAALAAAPRTDRLRSLVLYEPPIALQHCPADLADRADELIRHGNRDAAVEAFLREAAAVPQEEIAILRSLPPVWERAAAGIPNGPRDLRAFTPQPVDLDALRRITVPVLLLVGSEQDAPVYLDGLDEIEQALPNARRAEIPGQRHLAPGLAPEAFAGLVTSFVTDAVVEGAPSSCHQHSRRTLRRGKRRFGFARGLQRPGSRRVTLASLIATSVRNVVRMQEASDQKEVKQLAADEQGWNQG